MPSNKEEKIIENDIKKYVNMSGGVAKRINSGKIPLSYINKKTGKTSFRAIHLEDKGTTDLIVDNKGICAWVEVKKNKAEYDKWLGYYERYKKERTLPKSYHTQMAQIQEKIKIERRGGNHILTYSLPDFVLKYNKLLG